MKFNCNNKPNNTVLKTISKIVLVLIFVTDIILSPAMISGCGPSDEASKDSSEDISATATIEEEDFEKIVSPSDCATETDVSQSSPADAVKTGSDSNETADNNDTNSNLNSIKNIQEASEEKHTGWFVTGGSRYYYDSNGNPYSGPNMVDDKYYIFSNEGKLITEDFLQQTINAIPESGAPIQIASYGGYEHKSNAADNYAETSSDNNSNNNSDDNSNDENAANESPTEYIHNTLVGVGNYTPTELDKRMVSNRLSEIGKNYHVGFVMMNLYNGKGVAYNIDNSEYSASSIKGPYVACITDTYPETIINRSRSMQLITTQSDNDQYNYLRESYGRNPLINWCEDLNLDYQVFNHYHPYLTSRELAKIWLKCYYYFNTDENGMQVSDWYTTPNNCAIFTTLGTYSSDSDIYNLSQSDRTGLGYRTETKAGWISSPHYCSTVDAGIVYPTSSAPYLIVICTDLPADMSSLEPLCLTLNAIYENTLK